MHYSTTMHEKLISISILSIKSMLNYIERTSNFPVAVRFNDVKYDVICRVNVPLIFRDIS